MENLFRLIFGFAFIIFVAFLVYQIFEQASSDTYVRLSSDLAEVQAGNNVIAKKNDLLRIRIESIKSDPRAIERKVRDELGMVRPDEVIIIFKNDDKAQDKGVTN